MSSMVGASVMKATIRISPPLSGHTIGKTSSMRGDSRAQVKWAARRWAGSAAGCALAAGGEVVEQREGGDRSALR